MGSVPGVSIQNVSQSQALETFFIKKLSRTYTHLVANDMVKFILKNLMVRFQNDSNFIKVV
jgi:hypothetical protein